MQPYTLKHAVAIAIALVAFLPSVLIPDLYDVHHKIFSLVLDIGIRSAAISVVFIGATLLLNISPDLNQKWINLLVWLKIK